MDCPRSFSGLTACSIRLASAAADFSVYAQFLQQRLKGLVPFVGGFCDFQSRFRQAEGAVFVPHQVALLLQCFERDGDRRLGHPQRLRNVCAVNFCPFWDSR